MARLQPLTSVLPLGLALAIASAVLLGHVATGVLAGDTAHFDDMVRAEVHQRSFRLATYLMLFVTTLGGPTVLALSSIGLFVLLWREQRRMDAWILAMSMFGASVLGTVLKLAFGRPRPVPYFDLETPATFSFPSGHALSSMCFFLALAMIFAPRVQQPARGAVWLVCSLMFLCIGFSRIYLGVHYPTDVVGGFLVASIWMSAVWIVLDRIRRRTSSQELIRQ